MVKSIKGTPYEHRWMNGNFEIHSIADIIRHTGYYIKGKYLVPEKDYSAHERDIALKNLSDVVREEVDWSKTQYLGVACISPASGFYLLQVFDRETPIIAKSLHHWEQQGDETVKLEPPQPCTRELEIIQDLTKAYSKLIRTKCEIEDLQKYANTWPKDRKLI